MLKLSEYADRYQTIAMTRDANGVLEVTLHTECNSMRWGMLPHTELAEAFRFIACDRENRVVLLTGTGHEFCGPRADQRPTFSSPPTSEIFERNGYTEARQLIGGLLDIPVPVVGVVNGPALRHCEMVLLSDIVVASEDATFEDSAHFQLQSYVPGDGIHVVMTMLLGINRARYFLLTGEVIGVQEAKRLGLVAEIHAKNDVLARGRAHAQALATKPDLLLRYTRELLVHPIKQQMHDLLGFGLGVEGLAQVASSPQR